MLPNDQPTDIQNIGSPYVGVAERSLSAVGSPTDRIAASDRHRTVSIRDTRFASGEVYLVAWDVVCHGNSDMSIMLGCSAGGDYFLLCRSGDQPDIAASIATLSSIQAALWFDRLPIRFAPRDSRWS